MAPVQDLLSIERTCFSKNSQNDWVACISEEQEILLFKFLEDFPNYRNLDRSVQLALYAASKIQGVTGKTAVNIGSSRGATGLWEHYHEQFLKSQEDNKVSLGIHASPLTTLGNISSWVAQFLQVKETAFSHSITCATAAHSILNAIAWMESGMAERFIAGGSEAPLTEFTIGQMKALRIYSNDKSEYPCRALDTTKSRNTMILGEAAALFYLTKNALGAKAKIIGYGTAIEPLTSATSVTVDGLCLRESMKMALGGLDIESIDAILTHAPGTIKGDTAEINAIESVFGDTKPYLCNTKWQLGHSLGASAAISLVLAMQMIESGDYPVIPYLHNQHKMQHNPERILINATGFGGNAVSLVVERV